MKKRPDADALIAFARSLGPVEAISPSDDATLRWLDDTRVVLTDGDIQLRATVFVGRDRTYVSILGQTFEVAHEDDARAAAVHAGGEMAAVSPMTGVIAAVHVAAGDTVESGAALFVVEAMKMEYVVRAPRDVAIAAVNGAAGEQVDLGAEVVQFAPDDDAQAEGGAS